MDKETGSKINGYNPEQIEKAVLLYRSFTNAELYRHYNNLRYFPNAETTQVVQQTLAELRIVFETRALPMPKWRRVKRRSILWKRLVRLFSGRN